MRLRRASPADRTVMAVALAVGVALFAVLLQGKMGRNAGSEAVGRRGDLRGVLSVSETGPDGPVRFVLQVTNEGEDDALLEFRSAQRYDFVVSRDGRDVWRWSNGKLFRPVPEQISLPAGAQVVCSEIWEGPETTAPEPETYAVVALFLGRLRPGDPVLRVGPVRFARGR